MRQNLGVLLRIVLALNPDLTPTSMTPRVLHHHRELQHFRLINHFGKILMTTWQKENQQYYVPPVCCGQIWDVNAIHSSHPYSLDNAEKSSVRRTLVMEHDQDFEGVCDVWDIKTYFLLNWRHKLTKTSWSQSQKAQSNLPNPNAPIQPSCSILSLLLYQLPSFQMSNRKAADT